MQDIADRRKGMKRNRKPMTLEAISSMVTKRRITKVLKLNLQHEIKLGE